MRAAGQTSHGLAKRNYALLAVLLETGLRVGEVAALRIGDLAMHDRSGMVPVREGKGRKQREVPLNSNARRALKLFLKGREPLRGEDYVFLSSGPCRLLLPSWRAAPGSRGFRFPRTPCGIASLCGTSSTIRES